MNSIEQWKEWIDKSNYMKNIEEILPTEKILDSGILTAPRKSCMFAAGSDEQQEFLCIRRA